MNSAFVRYWHRRRHVVLLVLLVAITVARHVSVFGSIYNRNVYPVIGRTLSAVSGYVPFAVGDVFIAGSVAWVLLYPVYALLTGRRRAGVVWAQVAEYLLWLYVWFYVAWGLNYAQPDIFRRMNMRPVAVDAHAFRHFAYAYADSLNATYSTTYGAYNKDAVKNCIQQGYESWAQSGTETGINRPFCGHPPAKTMVFSPLAGMAGIWGSMAPFFCEFTLNANLLLHEYPSTYAHELSHFYGVTNEGEANFYSYVVCTSSSVRAIRFSGYYQILFHVLSNVRTILGTVQYEQYLKRLRPEILLMAQHDRMYWLKRRSLLVDGIQSWIYNLYLRGNNVQDGLQSYSGVLAIIMTWESRRSISSSRPARR